MTYLSLRIEPVALWCLDAELCVLGMVRLVRCAEGLFVECSPELADRAAGALARAGARVGALREVYRVPAELVPGVASDLERIPTAGIVDVVTLRPLTVAEATARLTARGPLGRRRIDVGAVHALLREMDRAYAWHRVVWAPRRIMRSRALGSVRPVVFDRAAVARPREHIAFAKAMSLTRWAS